MSYLWVGTLAVLASLLSDRSVKGFASSSECALLSSYNKGFGCITESFIIIRVYVKGRV